MPDINAKDPEQNRAKARVLLVDDSKLVRASAKKALSDKFDLVLAENGEEAWEKIRADRAIQVVFTDLGMPKLDGYGLIQRVRQSEDERIRHQPIIVITGAAEEEGIRRKVFEVGATDFITKPFKATELIARADAHASYRRDKENLQTSADLDVLTGTLNRKGLEAQLEKDVSFVNRHSEHLAAIIFELDDFKRTYDQIGEESSNRIIKAIGTTLLSAIRKEDSVGRYGWETFVVILPMAKTEGVVNLAKRLCAKVEAFKMTVGGQPLSVSMSAGICAVKKGARVSAKSLINSAENALRNAREVGAGEVQILKPEAGELPGTAPPISTERDPVNKEQNEATESQIDQALSVLEPLVTVMSEQQKRRLITLAQAGARKSS